MSSVKGFCLIVLCFLVFYPVSALAANCSSPTGAEGSINYDTTTHVMYFCNGTAWTSMSGGGGGGITCPSGMQKISDTANGVGEYCIDNTNSSGSCSAAADACAEAGKRLCHTYELSKAYSLGSYGFFHGGWTSDFSVSVDFPGGTERSLVYGMVRGNGSTDDFSTSRCDSGTNYYCCKS